ncbi:MAG: sensor histidine kinase [Ferruginibacter sp.]
MTRASILSNEKDRVESLRSYSILDTLPEQDYDNLTAIAASICNTPISQVSLVDVNRQWLKSSYGTQAIELSREFSFCAHAINDPVNLFTVADTRIDERFRDNPIVTGEPHVIFYAGVPLVNEEGFALGSLCVIDHKPRTLTAQQVTALQAVSKQVMHLLELRRIRIEHEENMRMLKQRNEDLEHFAFVAAHDLKTPGVNINNMARLFLKLFGNKLDERGAEIMDIIVSSAGNLVSLIDGLLDYSRCDKILQEKKQVIEIADLKKEIAAMFYNRPEVTIQIHSNVAHLTINKTALSQILSNLLSNAVKYNNKEQTMIGIGITETASRYEFYLQDNGPGIPQENLENVFTLFEVFAPEDRYGKRGNGIGLATVKRLVQQMGGTIEVRSDIGKGACFYFTIPV